MSRQKIYNNLLDKLSFMEKQYLTSSNEDISKIFLNEIIEFHEELFNKHNRRVKEFFYKNRNNEKYKTVFEYKTYERDYFLDVQDAQFKSCLIDHYKNMKQNNVLLIEESEKLNSFSKFKLYIDGLHYLISKFN